MRARVAELHYEYCAPKPERFFKLWDSEVEMPPDNESPEGLAERESINKYVHLVV